MIDFVIGVVVGAAFAPFWMTVYNFLKAKVQNFLNSK